MDHECKHEVDIAIIQKDCSETKETVDKTFKLLNRLVTQTELNKQSNSRIWYFIGALYVAIIGVCGKILYAAII